MQTTCNSKSIQVCGAFASVADGEKAAPYIESQIVKIFNATTPFCDENSDTVGYLFHVEVRVESI